MITPSSAARFLAALVLLATIVACRPTRTVKLEWDAPAGSPTGSPTGYRILVDDKLVMDIPPPPVDPSCKCLRVSLPVPTGTHTVKVVAYSPFGSSPPSIVSVLK
jgi:hypothetical protein